MLSFFIIVNEGAKVMRVKLFLYIVVIFLFSNVFALAALDLNFATAIVQSPDPASAGDVVTFTVSFKTTGGAVTNLKIIGGIDGAQLFERTYASIAADKIRTDSFTWTAAAGSHTAWFELDPDHVQGDIDYSNNRIEKTITIGSSAPTDKPNLIVSAVYNPTSVTNGANITFTATVTNIGNAPAAPSKLGFSVFGGLEGEYDIPALNPGQKSNIAINWIANCNQPCNAYIDIKADSTNLIDETNESDNDWIKQSICDCSSNYKPNMTVSANYNPANPKKGDKVTFNIIVKNEGNKESSRVYLGISILGEHISSIEVDPMAKNSQKTFTYGWIADCIQPCHAPVDLFIDNANEAEESSENDNHWIKDISCDCTGSLPLISHSITLQKKTVVNNISALLPNLSNTWKSYVCHEGQKKVDLKFYVTNNGKAASAASKLRVKIYDTANTISFTGSFDIQPLNVNQTVQMKVNNMQCTHNSKMVVTIDPDNSVIESNENDNQWTVTINCPNL
jgi:subtilase family serine protease